MILLVVRKAKAIVELAEFLEYRVKDARPLGSASANILDFAVFLGRGFTATWRKHLEQHIEQREEKLTDAALRDEGVGDVDDFAKLIVPEILLYARSRWTLGHRNKVIKFLSNPEKHREPRFVPHTLFIVEPAKQSKKKKDSDAFVPDASIRSKVITNADEQKEFKEQAKELATRFAACFDMGIPPLDRDQEITVEEHVDHLAKRAFTVDNGMKAWEVLRPIITDAALRHVGIIRE